MNTPYEKRYRIVAAAVTAVVTLLLFVLVFLLTLRYVAPQERTWPPHDTAELLFEGEYVMTGDIAVPNSGDNTPAQQSVASNDVPEAHDIANAGQPAPVPTPLVSSSADSPMKVAPPKESEKTGPTAAELEQQRKEKQQKEAAAKINNQVRFGSSAAATGSGAGKSGSPDGNAAVGALSGRPGHTLSGRSLAHWDKPKASSAGTVIVKVRVNRQGKVVSASYSGGSGPVASSEAARRSCEQAAMRSGFSVAEDAPAEQVGTITYRFN